MNPGFRTIHMGRGCTREWRHRSSFMAVRVEWENDTLQMCGAQGSPRPCCRGATREGFLGRRCWSGVAKDE